MEREPSPLVALVTGANRGIGLEVVRQLAERGYDAYLASRDQGKGEAAAGRLVPEVARRVSVVALDVSDPEAVGRAAEQVTSRHGYLHALVNNAGIHYDTWQRAANADLTPKRSRRTSWGRGARPRPSSPCYGRAATVEW